MLIKIYNLISAMGGGVSRYNERENYIILDLCCVGHAQDVVKRVNNSIGFSARNKGRIVRVSFSKWE